MKTVIPFLLVFVVLMSGCSNPTGPSNPNHVLLLSGFTNGADSLSAFNQEVVNFDTPTFRISSYDTIEISLTYGHFGRVEKTFALNDYHWTRDTFLLPAVWSDTLTRGVRSMRMTIPVSQLRSPDTLQFAITSAYYGLIFLYTPLDSTYIYNLNIIGYKK